MECVRHVPRDLKKPLHKTDSATNTTIIGDWMIGLIKQLFTGHCSFDAIFSVENLPHFK